MNYKVPAFLGDGEYGFEWDLDGFGKDCRAF